MDHADPDDLLDSELSALPPPRAPQTLLPRVMAAAAEQARRPAPTGWVTWPRQWQLASMAALVSLVAVIVLAFSSAPAGVSDATRIAGDTATVARVFWDVLLEPVAAYIFVLGLSLALACAAAWAALELALGGASHR